MPWLGPDAAMPASILVVEDEPAIQELVAYTCSSNGYTVRRAESVGAAREAIGQQLPDLVLLDWMLPDKPGIDLLKDLRTEDRTRAVPVIMVQFGKAARQYRTACVVDRQFIRAPQRHTTGGLQQGKQLRGRTHLRLPEDG